MFSVKDNTQRYKSLTGSAIFPLGAIFAYGKRYALAFLAKGEICQKREGIYIISHWSEATIYRTSKASISRLHSKHIAKQKKEITFRLRTDLLSLSACNMGLGLAHLYLTSQMRCLHFCQSVNSPLRIWRNKTVGVAPSLALWERWRQSRRRGFWGRGGACSSPQSASIAFD